MVQPCPGTQGGQGLRQRVTALHAGDDATTDPGSEQQVLLGTLAGHQCSPETGQVQLCSPRVGLKAQQCWYVLLLVCWLMVCAAGAGSL